MSIERHRGDSDGSSENRIEIEDGKTIDVSIPAETALDINASGEPKCVLIFTLKKND